MILWFFGGCDGGEGQFVDDNLRIDGSKIAKVVRGETITFDEMLSSITSDGAIDPNSMFSDRLSGS